MSAFAARKAALAAQQAFAPPARDSTPPLPSPSPVPAQKPTPKRKPSGQTPNSVRKKQKKPVKHAREEHSRYFVPVPTTDAFDHGADIIQIDSEESDEGDVDEDRLLDNANGFIALQPAPKRSWSPSRPLPDSSDEEDDAPAAVLPAAVQEQALLSTFTPETGRNTFNVIAEEAGVLGLSSNENATILCMAPGQTLSLLGVYSLLVLSGTASLSGLTLTSSIAVHRVFAPRSSPIPVICALESQGGPSTTTHVLPSRLRSALPHNNGAILALQSLRTGVESLGKVVRTFENTFEVSRWQKSTIAPELGIDDVHVLTTQTKDVQPFLVPKTWERALSSVDSQDAPGVYLVKGPKKSGKSTFARTLLNRLSSRYQKVAFLECDLGQSEFTPGGMVALNIIERPVFGAPFTHPSHPHQAHYIGGTSPRSSPSHYLTAIQALIQTYRFDIQNSPALDDDETDDRLSGFIPLVVNTMGWIKGLGADIARKLEDIVEPTHIFEVEAPIFESGWTAPVPLPIYGANHVLLEPIAAAIQSTTFSPADHRMLSIMSYLHASFPLQAEMKQTTATSWNTSLPLCAVRPFEVDVSVAFDKIMLAGAGMEDVVSTELDRVLTCSIVGLVECDTGSLDLDGVLYTQGSSAPSPATSRCHGLAVIRAVASGKLHMLTPMHAVELEKSRVLLKGEMELPIWGMLDHRLGDQQQDDEGTPFLQWGKGEGIGGEKRRIRRNLMRKGQM